ncbi:hypothetical protein WQE_16094 [Paraburkholderia hospita]|uniref:Uncharacterized protein n=1 Tax=Paraburkholderia hospita TaxID=169430 RepID=A0ABP2PR08_9BURK|nr:hypothetical protein WQE_16094 [Paraburkholderia hospita]OUL87789.1 hypothetical protein CA602_12600 [Paraburkholderia hospita]
MPSHDMAYEISPDRLITRDGFRQQIIGRAYCLRRVQISDAFTTTVNVFFYRIASESHWMDHGIRNPFSLPLHDTRTEAAELIRSADPWRRRRQPGLANVRLAQVSQQSPKV